MFRQAKEAKGLWIFGRVPVAVLISVVIGSSLGVVSEAAAQHDPRVEPSNSYVIRGATVHTLDGEPIENGVIVLRDGMIVEVGADIAVPAGATLIDATGLHVYPGLISPDTLLGLVETGSVDVTRDYDERGDVTPEVWAAVAVNPDTDLIPVTRANGILTALIYPRGGLVSGRASLIRLDGWTWEQMAIEPSAGLVLNWPQTEARALTP